MTLDSRLHAYQVRAIEHLHGTGEPGAALFLDMGLGKTAVVLQALTPDHLPALVLAPKRVAEEVWEVETDKWRPDLSVRMLANLGPTVEYPRVADRRRALLMDGNAADLTVITRDQAGEFGRRKHPYKTIVLDELSSFKNPSSARWKTARDVARWREVRHVWGLTGTPVPNGYEDLFGQIKILDEGRRLGQTVTEYRDRYFNDVKRHRVTNVVIERALKPGAQASIDRLLEGLCLSMKKEDYLPDLPDLLINEVHVSLPPIARRAYSNLEDTLVADLRLLGMDVHTAANAAVLTSKLQQVTAGFLYSDLGRQAGPVDRLHDEKTKALKEIIDGTGDNVLVFYWFDEERQRILADKDIDATSIDEPGAVKAWNRGEIPVLLAHPASAGHGLNLQDGGATMVWTTLPWGLEFWEQGIGRLHRQGQGRPVVCHVLLIPGTVDRAAKSRLVDKKSVQDALMDYLKENHLWL